MSAHVAVELVETAEPHQVLRHVLAVDVQAAAPWVALWGGYGSTRAGRILGLIPPPARTPGLCDCGTELPLATASTSARKTYDPGKCYECTARARAERRVR